MNEINKAHKRIESLETEVERINDWNRLTNLCNEEFKKALAARELVIKTLRTALVAQQNETTCECGNCMRAQAALEIASPTDFLNEYLAETYQKNLHLRSEIKSLKAKLANHTARQKTEVDRLTKCLQQANTQTEHFEREWYLRGDQIESFSLAAKAVIDAFDALPPHSETRMIPLFITGLREALGNTENTPHDASAV